MKLTYLSSCINPEGLNNLSFLKDVAQSLRNPYSSFFNVLSGKKDTATQFLLSPQLQRVHSPAVSESLRDPHGYEEEDEENEGCGANTPDFTSHNHTPASKREQESQRDEDCFTRSQLLFDRSPLFIPIAPRQLPQINSKKFRLDDDNIEEEPECNQHQEEHEKQYHKQQDQQLAPNILQCHQNQYDSDKHSINNQISPSNLENEATEGDLIKGGVQHETTQNARKQNVHFIRSHSMFEKSSNQGNFIDSNILSNGQTRPKNKRILKGISNQIDSPQENIHQIDFGQTNNLQNEYALQNHNIYLPNQEQYNQLDRSNNSLIQNQYINDEDNANQINITINQPNSMNTLTRFSFSLPNKRQPSHQDKHNSDTRHTQQPNQSQVDYHQNNLLSNEQSVPSKKINFQFNDKTDTQCGQFPSFSLIKQKLKCPINDENEADIEEENNSQLNSYNQLAGESPFSRSQYETKPSSSNIDNSSASFISEDSSTNLSTMSKQLERLQRLVEKINETHNPTKYIFNSQHTVHSSPSSSLQSNILISLNSQDCLQRVRKCIKKAKILTEYPFLSSCLHIIEFQLLQNKFNVNYLNHHFKNQIPEYKKSPQQNNFRNKQQIFESLQSFIQQNQFILQQIISKKKQKEIAFRSQRSYADAFIKIESNFKQTLNNLQCDSPSSSLEGSESMRSRLSQIYSDSRNMALPQNYNQLVQFIGNLRSLSLSFSRILCSQSQKQNEYSLKYHQSRQNTPLKSQSNTNQSYFPFAHSSSDTSLFLNQTSPINQTKPIDITSQISNPNTDDHPPFFGSLNPSQCLNSSGVFELNQQL